MTSSYSATYARFCVFYSDDRLTGHCFLRPSIFVKQAAQWIVSPLPASKWEKSIEILGRVILTITLPILALLAAILIPCGLICKSISSRFFPPPPTRDLPTTFKPCTFSQKEEAQNEAIEEHFIQEPDLPIALDERENWKEIFARASMLVDSIQTRLAECIFSVDSLETLYEMQDLMQNNSDLILILSKGSVQQEQYSKIKCSAEEIFNFIQVLIFQNTHFPINEGGVAKIQSGFLLLFFEAYTKCNACSELDLDPDKITETIRKWILKNYKNNKPLQRYLNLSMILYYHAEFKQLRAERFELSLTAGNEKDKGKKKLIDGEVDWRPDTEKEQRLAEVLHTLKELSKHQDDLHTHLISLYLDQDEFQKKDIGPAEIYALCQLYGVCVQIKTPHFEECQKMGEEFAGEKQPLIINTDYFI